MIDAEQNLTCSYVTLCYVQFENVLLKSDFSIDFINIDEEMSFYRYRCRRAEKILTNYEKEIS